MLEKEEMNEKGDSRPMPKEEAMLA